MKVKRFKPFLLNLDNYIAKGAHPLEFLSKIKIKGRKRLFSAPYFSA
jgi:hypothetical protein